MADGIHATLDFASAFGALNALDGEMKESLARRMLVSGGVLLRDHAKAAAPRSDGPYNPNSRGSHASGTLANSIYLAFDTTSSGRDKYVYKVTWNAKTAWWGKLAEHGYWRKYEVHRDNNGNFYTDKTKPLAAPVWVPPQAFLGRTISTYGKAAIDAMNERGRAELPLLLQGIRK